MTGVASPNFEITENGRQSSASQQSGLMAGGDDDMEFI
jgi:hypothetical protein